MKRLPENSFLKAIRNGEKQIGLWISLSNNFVADVVASAGYDWVLVDMEHSPNEIASVLGQLQAFDSHQCTAIVRPSWNDPVKVKPLLDIGAKGLLFPMVQSAEEADLAVRSTCYPPRGIRGVSSIHRGSNFGRIKSYNEQVENETAVLVQIETRHAIEKIDEMLETDGIDGIFFGPSDIAADIGLLGKTGSSELWDLIMPAAQKAMDKGIPVGTLTLDPNKAIDLFNSGFTFIACGMDVSLLARSADHLLETVKKGLV